MYIFVKEFGAVSEHRSCGQALETLQRPELKIARWRCWMMSLLPTQEAGHIAQIFTGKAPPIIFRVPLEEDAERPFAPNECVDTHIS